MRTLLFASLGLMTSAAYAQFQPLPPVVIEESAQLLSPSLGDTLGDVSIDGNRVVLGGDAYFSGTLEHRHVAYLYERQADNSWQLTAELLDVTRGGTPGWTTTQVAIEGNVIAVAMLNETHVFERTAAGWTETAVLTPPSGVTTTGVDVEISGGTILVGAQSFNYQAVAYRKNSSGQWQPVQVMTASAGESDDEFFGGDVDIANGNIILGSPLSNWGYRAEAHIFSGPTSGPWPLVQVATAPPGPSIGLFGQAVGISDNYAIVAGTGETGIPLYYRGSSAGAWGWASTIELPDALTTSWWATTKMDGTRAFVGLPFDEDRGPSTGSINVFQRTRADDPATFDYVAKLLPRAVADFLNLGRTMDVSGNTVVGLGQFGAYVFDLPATFSRPPRLLETFQDGVADGWTPQGVSSWAVAPSGETTVYRQSSVAEGAQAILSGTDRTNQSIEADVRPLTFSGSDRWFGLLARYQDASNHYYVTLRSSNTIQLRRMLNGTFMMLQSAPLTMTAGKSYRVRLEAVGTLLRVYVDGALVMEHVDTSLSHGSVGLAMYKTSTEYDNVVVTSSPSLTLVAEDFEDGSAQHWTTSGDGAWSYPTDGTRVYRQTSTAGGARAVVGREFTYDQVIEADIKALSFSGSDRWFGLIARYAGDGQYYYVTMRSSNRVALRKQWGTTVFELDTAPFTITPGTWYHMRLEAIGENLRVYIDDTLVLEGQDDSFTAGRAGFGMYKAVAEIDNVRISQP